MARDLLFDVMCFTYRKSNAANNACGTFPRSLQSLQVRVTSVHVPYTKDYYNCLNLFLPNTCHAQIHSRFPRAHYLIYLMKAILCRMLCRRGTREIHAWLVIFYSTGCVLLNGSRMRRTMKTFQRFLQSCPSSVLVVRKIIIIALIYFAKSCHSQIHFLSQEHLFEIFN